MFSVSSIISFLPSVVLESPPEKVPLTIREGLSGALGSISLACWLFLLLPQLLENYRNQSAEAISLPFVLIWFLGDIFNLVGGLWADLVPVVIAIGGYFCIADGVLIGQVLYYGIRNRRREGRSWIQATRESVVRDPALDEEREAGIIREETSHEGFQGSVRRAAPQAGHSEDAYEDTPLLKQQSRDHDRPGSITIPGSQSPMLGRRRSSGIVSPLDTNQNQIRRRHSSTAAESQLAKIFEETDTNTGAHLWLRNTLSVLLVCFIGAAGWGLAYESGAWVPSNPPSSSSPVPSEPVDPIDQPSVKGAQILGYSSAVLYLCARIPQIVKNYRDQSCEGLSLLFFILSIMGNLTYGAGILAHSTQHDYVIKNVPWLIGSLGTMVEDVIIFVQFHLYRDRVALSERSHEPNELPNESAIM